jgi:pimeloyl-ACP methyl ester carboxylesterase
VLLANKIKSVATPATPASIVAHSQGGLVARAAWEDLLLAGKSNLLRRIITLGTPHKGCYAPAVVFTAEDELFEQVSRIQSGIAAFANGINFPVVPDFDSVDEMERITATWVSLYQLFPLVDSESRTYDPLRAELLVASNWPSKRNVSELHLEGAADDMQRFLRAPASLPPFEVLTTIAGTGQRTPEALQSLESLGQDLEAFRYGTNGDGHVTETSALVYGSARYVVPCGHADLMMRPDILAGIGEMVLAQRSSIPPQVNQLSGGFAIATGPPLLQPADYTPDP